MSINQRVFGHASSQSGEGITEKEGTQMHRFNLLVASVLFMCLLPLQALAQDIVLPGPGEIRELRSDEARCPDGYRCFLVGSYVRGAQLSPDTLLARVNRDIANASQHVSMAQFEAANPCRVLFVRGRNGHQHFAKNGACESYNHSRERLTYDAFCSDASHCGRWLIASGPRHQMIYRVPAARHLTPSERAEEMVNTLDGTEVAETVLAPAQLGRWLTEFHDLMGEEQPPTYEEARHVIGAIGRTLTRTPGEASSEHSAETNLNHAQALPAIRPPLQQADASGRTASSQAPVTTAASRNTQQNLSSAEQTSQGLPSFIILLLGLLVGAGVSCLVFFLLLRQRDSRIKERESVLLHNVQIALSQRDEQSKLNETLRICWSRYSEAVSQNMTLSPQHLRNAFCLIDRYLALQSACDNRRGELDEKLLKELCEKADKFDALGEVQEDAPIVKSNNKLECIKPPKLPKGVLGTEDTLSFQELVRENEEQALAIKLLHEEVANERAQGAFARQELEELDGAFAAFRKRVLESLWSSVSSGRLLIGELNPYIEDPSQCHNLLRFHSLREFLQGLERATKEVMEPLESFFSSLADELALGGSLPPSVADPNGTRVFSDPNRVKRSGAWEELSSSPTTVSSEPLPRTRTHPYVRLPGEEDATEVSDRDPIRRFRQEGYSRGDDLGSRIPTIPIVVPPPSADEQDGED